MNRHLELRLRAIDAVWRRRFDQRTEDTLRRGQGQRGRDGVNRRQREDWSVVILDGAPVLTMMLQKPVWRRVAMDHELRMPVVFALVHVLGCRHRRQADSQAEHARDDPGHPHA